MNEHVQIKNVLSMKSQDYHKIDAKMLEYVQSKWIETEEGKKAEIKFGVPDYVRRM